MEVQDSIFVGCDDAGKVCEAPGGQREIPAALHVLIVPAQIGWCATPPRSRPFAVAMERCVGCTSDYVHPLGQPLCAHRSKEKRSGGAPAPNSLLETMFSAHALKWRERVSGWKDQRGRGAGGRENAPSRVFFRKVKGQDVLKFDGAQVRGGRVSYTLPTPS